MECASVEWIQHQHYLCCMAFIGSVWVRASHTLHETQYTCVPSRECNHKSCRSLSLSVDLFLPGHCFDGHFSVLMLTVFFFFFISDKVINVVNFICPYFFCYYCAQFIHTVDRYFLFFFFIQPFGLIWHVRQICTHQNCSAFPVYWQIISGSIRWAVECASEMTVCSNFVYGTVVWYMEIYWHFILYNLLRFYFQVFCAFICRRSPFGAYVVITKL